MFFYQEDVQRQASKLNWFSWGIDDPEGAYPWAAGVVTRVDALDTVQIKYNGHDRVAERDALYFRTVQPYQRHSAIPNIFAYNYCLCLFPEEDQRPSGSSNVSRIDNVTFTFKFAKDASGASALTEDGSMTIMVRNYNVVKIAVRSAGLCVCDRWKNSLLFSSLFFALLTAGRNGGITARAALCGGCGALYVIAVTVLLTAASFTDSLKRHELDWLCVRSSKFTLLTSFMLSLIPVSAAGSFFKQSVD